MQSREATKEGSLSRNRSVARLGTLATFMQKRQNDFSYLHSDDEDEDGDGFLGNRPILAGSGIAGTFKNLASSQGAKGKANVKEPAKKIKPFPLPESEFAKFLPSWPL